MFQPYEPESPPTKEPPPLLDLPVDSASTGRNASPIPPAPAADKLKVDSNAPVFLLNPRNRSLAENRSGKPSPSGGGYIALLGLSIALATLILTFNPIHYSNLREQQGTVVMATVISQRAVGGRSGLTRYLKYTFSAEGKSYIFEEGVSIWLYNAVQPGDRLPLRYQIGYPANARLVDNPDHATPVYFYGGIGIGGLLMAAGLLAWGNWRHMSRHGQLVRGILTNCKGATAKGRFSVAVRYEFQTPRGRMLRGHGVRARSDLRGAALPEAGTPVLILWDGRRRHQIL